MAMTSTRRWLGLVAWLAITLAAGALGALASAGSDVFYARLDRPPWAPPASWFGPVWTALYVAMGVAAWIVWKERGFAGARGALMLYLAQLAANALWTWLFFAWRQGGAAFADIVLLIALVLATLVAFWRVRPVAGTLLLPYLAWVTFAAALNFTVWQRNPALLG